MQCPECERLGMVSVFLLGACMDSPSKPSIYYDEFGQKHEHTPGKVQPCRCSNGHIFKHTWEEECSINSYKWRNTYAYGESDTEGGPWCEDMEPEKLEIFIEPEPEEPKPKPSWLARLFD